MFNFADQLLQFVEVIVGGFFNIAESLLRALGLLAIVMQVPAALTGVLPGMLGAAVMLTTAILVVRFFLMK